MNNKAWDINYEWSAVLLLAVGFGLVGLDRFIILPLFPSMMKDLQLNYQDLGNISAVLAIAWGVASILMGRLSDRVGRRKVIIPAVVVFSLLAGFSGLATGVGALLVIRVAMGAAEGAFTPTSIAATGEASHPSRLGMNMGFQQAFFPLLGLGLAPILATQLLLVLPSWRWVFAVVALPGLLIAWLLYRTLREPSDVVTAQALVEPVPAAHWTTVLRYHNVVVNMLGMLVMQMCLSVVAVILPNYLTDFLLLDMQQMGFVMSALGLGGFLGMLIVPAISDHLGRKPVGLLCCLATAVCIALMINTGARPFILFTLLALAMFFNFAIVCMVVGPLTSESVPAALTSTATGMVVGIGEVFGGGVFPAVAGYIAQHYGIEKSLYLALGGAIAGFLVILFLRETAPAGRRKAEPSLGLDSM
ncbi:MFS transporter [Pseudomonas sp. PDNC002]|uniref:MFS transporter n=1 Tax=Pseudomonas sp. PDNC002 TaxID=2811422 RepID=UPI0019665892|nr:MFS transporter [Pseudomonas sp. PDNC002]QRY78144.1 MFS transporter [Pseudomonas sp. PDNC002]